MNVQVRSGLAAIFFAAAAFFSFLVPAGAQAADKPIRIVIYAAGGPVDFVARLLADELGRTLGQTVIVEPRPGANGIIAAQNVIGSDTDGTTLLLSSSGLFTISPTLMKLPYDPDRDLRPVGRVVVPASAIAVDANLPVHTLQEFIAYAKASPTPVTMATPGLGNVTQLWIEELQAAAGIKLTIVPYKGIAPAIADILGGRIAGTIADMPAFVSLRQAGKLRVLGLVGDSRSGAVPDVPTIREQGYPGVDTVSWYGLFAPRGTPDEVVRRLNQAVAQALSGKKIQASLRDMGMEPAPSSPRQFGQAVQADRARLAKIIKEKNITLE